MSAHTRGTKCLHHGLRPDCILIPTPPKPGPKKTTLQHAHQLFEFYNQIVGYDRGSFVPLAAYTLPGQTAYHIFGLSAWNYMKIAPIAHTRQSLGDFWEPNQRYTIKDISPFQDLCKSLKLPAAALTSSFHYSDYEQVAQRVKQLIKS